ncbi:hypothetical protein AAHE18_03G323400 [Arachis hypogaea]|uniref:IRK-interacting protein n=2 Tax=Arachis TaxID=3817 RepID=A0A445DNG1_ARAHY|nr:IRK-interacting protein [Arachis hypogaea]RYR64710.1 hypothetical protein Ahy_A03g010775 [Arachis hypogaea]
MRVVGLLLIPTLLTYYLLIIPSFNLIILGPHSYIKLTHFNSLHTYIHTMAASCSKSPPLPSRHSPHFTPIQEELEVDEYSEDRSRATPTPQKHPPTPIVNKNGSKSNHKKKRSESDSSLNAEDASVSCNKCRPHSRDKIFVLPILDHNHNHNHKHQHSSLLASPNGIFKSIVSKLTRKSPMSSSSAASREDQWKLAVAELSHKLVQATRKRDEALVEASRLMKSMAELEKKLNKLELYCHTLKSGLEECSSSSNKVVVTQNPQQETVIQHFLVSVSEARSSVRLLSRSLTMQLRHMGGGGKVYDKVSTLLQPYDIRISFSKNPRSLVVYLEALLNRAFYEDFETVGFMKNACNQVLNPVERCESNMESFKMVQGLTWEEVLSKGTRHFSSEFSRFCDRKMSEIVGMLGWNRAWPEGLLQAFFGASKSVWMVHLLANSVHPSLSILRVDRAARFESLYMEDMAADKSHSLVPTLVRIMVAPGFYVYGSAVKCKVLCRYLTSTPTP